MADPAEVVLLAVLVVGLLPLPLLGGRWSRLAHLELHGRAWLAACAAAQVGLAVVDGATDGLPESVAGWWHVGSYALLLPFLWANRGLAGGRTVLVGALLNLAAIAANGGVMPASPAAVRSAGLEATEGFANSRATEHARLAFLGDVWSVPDGVPLANVFSVGDVLLVVGALHVLHAAAGSRLAGRRRARPSEVAVP